MTTDVPADPTSPPPPPFAQGGRFGSYRIIRLLAQGGMAEVYLARRDFGSVKELVAIKRLLPHLARDPEHLKMFRTEAQLAGMLRHRNLPSFHYAGVLDGEHFIAMEYLHGADVLSILRRARKADARVPLGAAIQIAMGVAAALHHAHE